MKFIGCAAARGFSWTVVNDDPRFRDMPAPWRDMHPAHALATDHDAARESRETFKGTRLVQNVEMRRRELEETKVARYPMIACEYFKLRLFTRKHDELAREQGQEERSDRRVERQRIENWCSSPSAQFAGWNSPCDVVGNRGVIDHHALGCSRGARGVDDVGGVVRIECNGRCGRGLLRDGSPVGIEADDAGAGVGQLRTQRPSG